MCFCSDDLAIIDDPGDTKKPSIKFAAHHNQPLMIDVSLFFNIAFQKCKYTDL